MFISAAFAQEATTAAASAPSEPSTLMTMAPLVVIFILFYLLVIRPQSKRMKTHAQLLAALQVGDKVVTGGGVYGKIVAIGDKDMTIEIAPNVQVKVQKHTVSALQEEAIPTIETKPAK